MAQCRKYDQEYKVQAVKLVAEIGSAKAADELGIPHNTMYGWMRVVRQGLLAVGTGAHTPQSALTLNDKMIEMRKHLKALEKENKCLKEKLDLLAEAGAFFRREPSSLLRAEVSLHRENHFC